MEGMARVHPGFVPAPGDEPTLRTPPVFFGVLELLLRAGVTTVADAAFQDHVWRARLEEFRDLAHFRIVHCVVDSEIAFRRALQRAADNPVRRVHVIPSRIKILLTSCGDGTPSSAFRCGLRGSRSIPQTVTGPGSMKSYGSSTGRLEEPGPLNRDGAAG